jgi:hypothetical protein
MFAFVYGRLLRPLCLTISIGGNMEIEYGRYLDMVPRSMGPTLYFVTRDNVFWLQISPNRKAKERLKRMDVNGR